ncbi:MAG: Ribosomal RNA small subunit methyltransferase B [Alphaproteobacteria bacterium ADurb.Bin438]|nr:MAG: Ribosomal RNA small subunit methyltransferase B [Alphaproteobacteria bacterium ADurb.Bin438]
MVRDLAWKILINVLNKKETLKVQNFDNNLSDNDKAFLKLLVYSTIRHINKLEFVLSKFVKKRPDKDIKALLLLGITQILFIDVPAHACLFETVEVIKKSKFKNNASFVNGVLRNVLRNKEIPDISNFPSSFEKVLSKDYNKDEISLLSKELEQEPSLDISVKSDVSNWASELDGEIIENNTIRLNNPRQIFNLNGYDNGDWWVQSFAASLPVFMFSDLKNKKVADFCAAPGGKTAQILNMGGKVQAFDISNKRIKTLKENIERLKFKDIKIINANPCEFEFNEKFDAILVDAPCSGTGTLRKNPDVVLKNIDFKNLEKIQFKLLETALLNVNINGEVVYSTCSLMKKEGELLVKQVLNNFKDFSLVKEKRVFPDNKYQEGFYMALLKRIK